LTSNLGVVIAEQDVGRLTGTKQKTFSDLLPNITGRISETRQVINLQAFGFGTASSGFGPIPNIVGPFNVFDARAFISQTVVDVSASNKSRGEAHNVSAAQLSYRSAREAVIALTGTTYLFALASAARSDAARSQRDTADAL